jgi:hypothetical protein
VPHSYLQLEQLGKLHCFCFSETSHLWKWGCCPDIGRPLATDRSSTSAAVVGGCAKVTQFLVGLNLLRRGGEMWLCCVHTWRVYYSPSRERRYPAPVWVVVVKSVRLEKYQMWLKILMSLRSPFCWRCRVIFWAKRGLIPQLCVITDAAGIARELVHTKNQLEHRCRRSTLMSMCALPHAHPSMWNGADKQAGIEVVAFSIVIPLVHCMSSWVGRIQILLS